MSSVVLWKLALRWKLHSQLFIIYTFYKDWDCNSVVEILSFLSIGKVDIFL